MSDQMTTRDFLQQGQVIRSKINIKEERLNSLKAMMSLSSPKMREMPKTASPNLQPLEYFIAAKVDVENEILELQDALIAAINSIGSVIKQVEDDRQKQVLEGFYISDLGSLEQVASFLGFSPRQVDRFHAKGLVAVGRILGTELG